MWKNPLIKDLSLVLAIKLAVLYGLWLAFFHQPAASQAPTAQSVSQALVGNPSAHVPLSCKETRHDC